MVDLTTSLRAGNQYRKARPEDLDQIFDLYEQHRDYIWTDQQPNAFSVDRNTFHILLDYLYVAEQDGRIAAFMLAYDMRIWGYIEIICVHRGYRQHGHASALMDFIQRSNPHWRAIELCYDQKYDNIHKYLQKQGFDEPILLSWVQKKLA